MARRTNARRTNGGNGSNDEDRFYVMCADEIRYADHFDTADEAESHAVDAANDESQDKVVLKLVGTTKSDGVTFEHGRTPND